MPNEQQANSSAEDEQSTDVAPKHVTEDQLNRAITARLKDFEKKYKETLTSTLNSAIGGLDESIGKKLEELVSSRMETPKEKESKKGADLDSHPGFLAMKRELAEQKARADALDQQRAAADAKLKDNALRQTLLGELSKQGITDPSRQNIAIGYLVDASKRVRWSEDSPDELVFRGEDGADWSLQDGLKSWSKSDEAKLFMPPRGVQGSGSQPGGNKPPTKGNQPSKADMAQALFDAVKNGAPIG